MWIIIDSKPITATTIFGEYNHEFPINNSILMQIHVKSTTSSTTFDVYLKDVNWLEIYRSDNNQWELNELVSFPVYSNQTIYIENASVDEEFGIRLNYRRS